MVSRRFRKKVGLAGFAAEAPAPIVVGDKTEFSTTIPTTILEFSHDAPLRFAGTVRTNSLRRLTSTHAVRLPATQRWRSGKRAALPPDFRRINVSQ
jgi:hypothetical protein